MAKVAAKEGKTGDLSLSSEHDERAALMQDAGVAKTTGTVMGSPIQLDFPPTQFVMVFPYPEGSHDDSVKQSYREPMEEPSAAWEAIFHGREKPALVKDGISKQDFIAAVKDGVIDVLEGDGCNIVDFFSVDGDEHFVTIAIEDPKTFSILAAKHEARARVKPEAYRNAKKKVPTDQKMRKGKDFDFVHVYFDERHLNGATIDNTCTAFVRYAEDIKEKLEDLSEPDKLRIARRTITQHLSLPALEQAEVITKFFAAHDWEKVQELYARGWSNPLKFYQWPGAQMPDYLATYFGMQVAYFFHFYNSFIKWLSIPAILSVVVVIIRHIDVLSLYQVHLMNSAFGAGLCLWTTAFLASYKQDMDFKTLSWGMQGASAEVAQVRKSFRDELRGTCLETLQNLFHWVLCVLFIAETIGAVAYLTEARSVARDNPEESTMGIPNTIFVLAAKYLVTVNIKVVDFAWMSLSPWLSGRENWRTDAELKSAMTLKIFAVKFVVFYYPFVYTLFIQPVVDGCEVVKGREDHPLQGCLQQVRSDLGVFFITQVISEVVEVAVSIAMMYRTIKAEISRKSEGRQHLSYLEFQALGTAYTVTDEVADYMDVVFNFGFIAMFGVTMPPMCILCFLASFPLKRLAGYKFCYVQQRVIPRSQEGIGSWIGILNFVAYMGVTITCYIAIFIFHVEHADQLQMLMTFIVAERAVGIFKFAIEAFLSSKSVSQQRIEEYNEDVLDVVLSKDTAAVAVPKGKRSHVSKSAASSAASGP